MKRSKLVLLLPVLALGGCMTTGGPPIKVYGAQLKRGYVEVIERPATWDSPALSAMVLNGRQTVVAETAEPKGHKVMDMVGGVARGAAQGFATRPTQILNQNLMRQEQAQGSWNVNTNNINAQGGSAGIGFKSCIQTNSC